MKRMMFVFGTVLSLGLCVSNADAITVTNKTTPTVPANQHDANQDSSNTVYLLSWQDNKMMTTKGTFVTDGIMVVNNSRIEKNKIGWQKNNPVVGFIKDGDTIMKIIISPNE